MEGLRLSRGRIGGYVNIELPPDVATKLGAALGTILGERAIAVTARDYYPPSRMLKRAFTAGLMSTGVTVIDFHAATTPELIYAIKRFGARAGIQFLVSDFEEDYVNLKIYDSHGIEFPMDRLEEIVERARRDRLVRAQPQRIGWVTYAEYIHDVYMASLINYVDVDSITSASFRVVADLNYGPSDQVLPELLSQVGVDLVSLNSHKPPAFKGVINMPRIEALARLSRAVKAMECDLGIALSADASHVFFVDDQGAPLEPEEILALYMKYYARNSAVVTTNSASILLDSVASEINSKVLRVEYSPDSIARVVRRRRAAIGGADTGEYIFPGFSPSPDGILAALKLLEMLARLEARLSELRRELKRPPTTSLRMDLGGLNPVEAVYSIWRNRDLEEVITTPMGVKVKIQNRWVLIRPSSDGAIVIESERVGSVSELKSIAEGVRSLIISEGSRL